MTDQTRVVMRRAADFLRQSLPDIPGSFAGDQRLDPGEQALAWYVNAEAETPPQLMRQTVKLTLFARSAVRLDRDRQQVDDLAADLAALAERETFRAALGDCAVLSDGGAVYAADESFHTVSMEFKIFIREV